MKFQICNKHKTPLKNNRNLLANLTKYYSTNKKIEATFILLEATFSYCSSFTFSLCFYTEATKTFEPLLFFFKLFYMSILFCKLK